MAGFSLRTEFGTWRIEARTRKGYLESRADEKENASLVLTQVGSDRIEAMAFQQARASRARLRLSSLAGSAAGPGNGACQSDEIRS
jgi:hypothetical protein